MRKCAALLLAGVVVFATLYAVSTNAPKNASHIKVWFPSILVDVSPLLEGPTPQSQRVWIRASIFFSPESTTSYRAWFPIQTVCEPISWDLAPGEGASLWIDEAVFNPERCQYSLEELGIQQWADLRLRVDATLDPTLSVALSEDCTIATTSSLLLEGELGRYGTSRCVKIRVDDSGLNLVGEVPEAQRRRPPETLYTFDHK